MYQSFIQYIFIGLKSLLARLFLWHWWMRLKRDFFPIYLAKSVIQLIYRDLFAFSSPMLEKIFLIAWEEVKNERKFYRRCWIFSNRSFSFDIIKSKERREQNCIIGCFSYMSALLKWINRFLNLCIIWIWNTFQNLSFPIPTFQLVDRLYIIWSKMVVHLRFYIFC